MIASRGSLKRRVKSTKSNIDRSCRLYWIRSLWIQQEISMKATTEIVSANCITTIADRPSILKLLTSASEAYSKWRSINWIIIIIIITIMNDSQSYSNMYRLRQNHYHGTWIIPIYTPFTTKRSIGIANKVEIRKQRESVDGCVQLNERSGLEPVKSWWITTDNL